MDVSEVPRPGHTVYEDIAVENEYEPAKEWVQHFIHQGLKRGWCIRQAERHDEELEESLMRAEGSFSHIIGVHPHLMIARVKVELHEELGTTQFIEQLLHD
jgi:hypothetical protein